MPDEAPTEQLRLIPPCRQAQIEQLSSLLDVDGARPSVVVCYGVEATGKSLIVRTVLSALEILSATLESRECITGRHLLERIVIGVKSVVEAQDDNVTYDEIDGRCESLSALVVQLQTLLQRVQQFTLVFDGIDKQREAPPTLLPALARLGEVIPGLTIVMIVTAPRPRFLHLAGVPHIHFPPYDRSECLTIITQISPQIYTEEYIAALGDRDKPQKRAEDNAFLWSRFCGAVWDSLGKGAARDILTFRRVCKRLWSPFIAPIRRNEYAPREFSKLMVRNRVLFQSEIVLQDSLIAPTSDLVEADFEGRKKATGRSSHELPYYSRFLLIAAFLASHNPQRQDQTFFMKQHERKRKNKGGGTAKGRPSKHRKIQRKLLGPQPFPLERMLAIFYSIMPHDVTTGTADILTQIATLASLRLMVKASVAADTMDAGTKWRVNVGWEYVQGLAKSLKFEVEDFVAE